MPPPYKVFTIYAREDALYLEELRGQLRPLEIAGRIKVWSDREINPGVDWEHEIVHNLDTADIILILVSSAYYNSVYIHEKEIKYALARHEKGEAKVLPIIVRPCSFGDDPVISRLKVLPTDGKPVTDKRSWPERDDAWLDVVFGLKRTLQLLDNAETDRLQAIAAALKADADAKERAKKEKEAAQNVKKGEAAKRERDAAQQREQEAQRAAQARADEARREKEAAYHREHLAAWEQALAADNAEAYQQYLSHFPQGVNTSDAQRRIKQLNKRDNPALPWGRYASIAGGVIFLIWAIGYFPTMFQGNKANAHTAGVSTLNPNASPENTGVQKRKSGLDMVKVEGGTFMMGSPKSEADRQTDECQHSVPVKSFEIGKYEVTQKDWLEIMGNNPSVHKNRDDCPVENVSWDEVQTFIKTLNSRTSNGKQYRLPTEAEWEYAARGGGKAANMAKVYAGSNDIDGVAWYNGNSDSEPHPVGGKNPNDLGLHDMSGNVWEWCQDLYNAYPGCKAIDTGGRFRVIRGGGWYSGASYRRAAAHSNGEPAYRPDYVGFRLVSVSLQ